MSLLGAQYEEDQDCLLVGPASQEHHRDIPLHDLGLSPWLDRLHGDYMRYNQTGQMMWFAPESMRWRMDEDLRVDFRDQHAGFMGVI